MADAQTPDSGSERAAVDVAAGLVLAAVSIVCLAWFIPAHVGTNASEYDVSPAFFPNLASWLVLFLSLALVATRIIRIDRASGPLGGVSAGWPIVTQTITWSVVALLAWYGMEAIGYMPTAAAILVLRSPVATATSSPSLAWLLSCPLSSISWPGLYFRSTCHEADEVNPWLSS